jgi:hypothetical protein
MRAWLVTGVEELEPAEFLAAFMCLCIGGKFANDTHWMHMAVEAFDVFDSYDDEDQRIPIFAAARALLVGWLGGSEDMM